MIIEKYHLSRPAATRQFNRYILPEMEREMIIMGGRGDGDGGDDDNGRRGGGQHRRLVGGESPEDPPDANSRKRQLNHQRQQNQHQQRRHRHGPGDVHRRSIVICDVTTSFGRALLGRYVIDGHDVSGCGRNPAEVHALRRRYPNVRLDVVDVSDDDAVRKWASSLEGGGTDDDDDHYGGTMKTIYFGDVVLVVIATGSAGGGSAGTSPSRDRLRLDVPAWEVPREVFDATIMVDVVGASNVIRHFVPRMIRHRNMQFDITTSSGQGGESGGGTLVAVCSASPRRRRAAQCAAACAIEGLIGSVALSIPDPHCAATLSLTFEGLGGGTSGYLSGEEKGRGGKSEGGDVDLERWANVAGPMILGMNRRNNGSSMSVPGF